MNILIVGTAYPLRGGIAHFNALLGRHLTSRHNVETITFKRQYPGFLFPGKTQSEAGAAPGGVFPAQQLIDSINPFNWYAVSKLIRSRNPDLLIFKYWLPFFGPCFGTIARLAKRGTRTKVLFICDNIIPHERRPGDLAFTRYAFGAADYFIVQSDTVERELNSLFPGSRYRKAPHPVYENFGAPVEKATARAVLGLSAEKVILYFGYVRPYKGLDVLFESMKILREHGVNKNVLLLAVGECYDDETKYRAYLRDNQLDGSVRFISDYVPNDQVATYFSAADAVVLPYRSATQSGIVQIAYNFGKPVIATNVGGLAETVEHERTGYIVRPNDAAALSGAIDRFYNEGVMSDFEQNVREVRKKYSWESFVQTIEELVGT